MRNRSRNLGRVVQGINIAQLNLSTLMNRILDPMGLNTSQLTVLAHFSNQPNKTRTITSIAKAVDMNQPTVTKIVAYLMNQGWLSGISDPSDARKKLLSITPQGLGLVIEAYGQLTPAIDQAFVSLDDEQVELLLNSLSQLKHVDH